MSTKIENARPVESAKITKQEAGTNTLNSNHDKIIDADEAFLKDILNRQEARKQEPIIVAEEPLINCLRCRNFRLMDYMVSDDFNCKLVNGASCYHAIKTDNCNFEFARNITILSKKAKPCDCNKGAD